MKLINYITIIFTIFFTAQLFSQDVINPFHQPNIIFDKLNCYGGGDYDGLGIGQGDVDAALAGINDNRLDVNGDGLVTVEDASILQEYINGYRTYLLSWWNFLNKEDKIAWLDKMLAIDQTDTNTYISGVFTSRFFAEQLHINFYGYLEDSIQGKEIPEIFTILENGSYNIPVLYSALATQTSSHGWNSCLVGDNPLNFFDWQFIEPQYDKYNDLRVFGENWNPPIGSIIPITKVDKFKESGYFDAIQLVEFEIDSSGNPNLVFYNPNLLLTRPTVETKDENHFYIPEFYSLEQNNPNPFNPTTTIHYKLPEESVVTIIVYDMLGRKIHELISQKQLAGNHSINWNGRDQNGNNMSAGIYLYQLKTSDFVQTKKMLLLR